MKTLARLLVVILEFVVRFVTTKSTSSSATQNGDVISAINMPLTACEQLLA